MASGDVYVGEWVTIDASSKNIEQLRVGRTVESVTDTVFLRVLVRGAATLLFLPDGTREHFYHQTNGGPPVELLVKYSLQENQVTGKTLLVQENKFTGQLVNFFQDCPALVPQVSKTQYSIQDLRAVFRQYNACRQDETYATQAEKVQLSFGLVGGATAGKARFNSVLSEDLAKTTFKQQVSPTFGIALHAVLPRNRQKWSFYNELAWKPYSGKGHYSQYHPFTYVRRDFYTDYKVNAVGLTSMIRYQLLAGTSVRPLPIPSR